MYEKNVEKTKMLVKQINLETYLEKPDGWKLRKKPSKININSNNLLIKIQIFSICSWQVVTIVDSEKNDHCT